MDKNIMTKAEVEQRAYWVEEISRLSGNFGVDAERVEQEISFHSASIERLIRTTGVHYNLEADTMSQLALFEKKGKKYRPEKRRDQEEKYSE